MQDRYPENTIAYALYKCGIEFDSASDAFQQWMQALCPNWRFSEDFLSAIPRKWSLVEIDETIVCYLGSEKTIKDVTERCPKFDLLPIGALMNGSYLVIDLCDVERMTVGYVHQINAMAGKGGELDRSNYRSYNISYLEWLGIVTDNPADLRYT